MQAHPGHLHKSWPVCQQEQADYSLIDCHVCVIICSPFTAMLSRGGWAGCKCCLHLQKNLCCLTEGSQRLHKEEASDEDEDTEFFDAMEDSPAFITVTATENTQHRSVAPRDSLKDYLRITQVDVPVTIFFVISHNSELDYH